MPESCSLAQLPSVSRSADANALEGMLAEVLLEEGALAGLELLDADADELPPETLIVLLTTGQIPDRVQALK